MRAPYLDDGDVRLYHGDVLDVLREMDAESVQTCVTSPPYWGLRDYGTATWEGGETRCDHARQSEASRASSTLVGSADTQGGAVAYRETCGKCGARRVDAQLGLEPTPGEYVARMVEVFREVRRVLREDGTLWLNLGDSFASGGSGPASASSTLRGNGHEGGGPKRETLPVTRVPSTGLKTKDLVGIPWRVAFALQEDGWYLRSDVIWAKPNAMPESVTDRPTKAHEYLFLLTKSARYFYDAEAIREESVDQWNAAKAFSPNGMRAKLGQGAGGRQWNETEGHADEYKSGRNARSVWTITTKPYSGAHFATFPPELPERCIKAGSRGAGKRCDCDEIIYTPTGSGAIDDPSMTTGRAGMNRPRRSSEGTRPITRREQRDYAVQMRDSPHREEMRREAGPAFDHYVRTDASGARPAPHAFLASWTERGWLREPAPCTCPVQPADVVLDPFIGSGTTAWVARNLSRRAVGIDLNTEYLDLAADRLKQLSIFSEAGR